MEHNSNSIWYKLGLFFCWILNISPVLHISRDEEFDSISQLTDLRISILSLPWADKHLYFISRTKEKGFEIFSVLKISNLQSPRSRKELQECKSKFSELTDDASGIKSQLRIDFLKHKSMDCQNSINTLNNKVNSYIAIALVYAGLCTFLFKSLLKLPVSTISLVLWGVFSLSVIFLINVLVLLRRYLQVKGAEKSMFSSFKEFPDWKTLAEGIYIDWLTSQEEQIAAATLVKNIEKYFIRSVALSSVLLIAATLQPHSWFLTKPLDRNGSDTKFVLVDHEGNFSSQELLNLSKSLSPNDKVTFIYSSSNNLGKATTAFTIKALELVGKNSTIELDDTLFNTKLLIASMEEQQ
ncbi:hypothetical protein PVK64_08835 [Aliivibrio sp. S4TY2]|uniref:Uncharacterized protein n=1 Tax=Aliivibrio finisterrensis TaxID=511998 RepID=A0A4Q5KNV0_9GAMM|nr:MULTISPECIES: hypothetical protein [Aliivibrio]MDD9156291.1 hypothetical protein [Aliivibrio sp. S4TY2]MDD9160638.1 hypothetical protein [Aliivibrio sp. S4TY1]MDD9163998.1 hypothetical protein [Aliivibrio sp. S4MY2]MDD9168027.1 hypothetical protein [Aliivibrio sp. S4MY4]MDD9177170.1 hypothetical protein [Aliivibrio sp. A6]